MDIAAISTLLSSLKSATDIAKFLKESDISLEKAEAKLKLAELYDALAEVKMQLADVRELLIGKDEEIRKLQDEMKIKGNMVFDQFFYWLVNEDVKSGPFCIACYDGAGRLARLIEKPKGRWICGVCGKVFYDSNYKPEKLNRKISGGVAF
jgi:hypothetical protein